MKLFARNSRLEPVRAAFRTGLIFALFLVSACNTGEFAQVTVYVTADDMVRDAANRIAITLYRVELPDAEGNKVAPELLFDEAAFIKRSEWPYRIGLQPAEGADPRTTRYRIVVGAASTSDGTIVEASATSGYIPGQAKALLLELRPSVHRCMADLRRRNGKLLG